jgi:hypothetical protein
MYGCQIGVKYPIFHVNRTARILFISVIVAVIPMRGCTDTFPDLGYMLRWWY